MTISLYADGTRIPDEKVSDLQIWNQTLQTIFDDVVRRTAQDDGDCGAA